MTSKNYKLAVVAMATALVLFALVLTAISGGGGAAVAAPALIPTPVSVTRPATSGNLQSFNPFTAVAVTGDTTSNCIDVGSKSVIDVLYVIDQGAVNTVTLTSKWSIDGVTTVSGVNVVASNAADASDMTQLQVFGRYFCLLADVSNSNAVTVTAQAVAK